MKIIFLMFLTSLITFILTIINYKKISKKINNYISKLLLEKFNNILEQEQKEDPFSNVFKD